MSTLGPEPLARLMDEHGAALVLYARQWCASPEDAVQDSLLQLVREPRLPDNVVGWLYRVVRNRAISASRATGARSRHEATAAFRGEPWFAATDEDRLTEVTAVPIPPDPITGQSLAYKIAAGGAVLELSGEAGEADTSYEIRLAP